jgi:hypothetical protein
MVLHEKPAGQGAHDDKPVCPCKMLKVPAGHERHTDCMKMGLNIPAAHDKHNDWPVSAWKVPAGHHRQAVEFTSLV